MAVTNFYANMRGQTSWSERYGDDQQWNWKKLNRYLCCLDSLGLDKEVKKCLSVFVYNVDYIPVYEEVRMLALRWFY